MSKQIQHGSVIYESLSQAAELIGVSYHDMRQALKIGYLKGQRIAVYIEPEPAGKPEPVKIATRNPGPLLPRLVKHGIGVMRK